MKTTQADHGETIPGGFGPALPPPAKPWGELDERCQRRKMQERASVPVTDGYRTWAGPDWKLITEKAP